MSACPPGSVPRRRDEEIAPTPETGPVRPCPPEPGYRLVCLVQLANFGLIRRSVGAARSGSVTLSAAALIENALHGSRALVIGRDMIEIVAYVARRGEIEATVAALARLFDVPLSVDGVPHLVEIAVGASFGGDRHDDLSLTEHAEQALAQARDEGRVVIRDLGCVHPPLDRVAVARELRGAITRGELLLHYQPKLHVRRQEIVGVEALIRWQHPVRGLVLPGEFIPLVEEAREIVALTLWTLRRVIADQRVLAERGHDLPVFINITGALLSDAGFVRQASELVQASGARIGFEITETSVIRDPASAICHLKTLAEVGVTIAIDDYGAGLSSLAYLKQLPARELKIDKLFVTQLTSSHRDPLIVRSTIDLAHALGMEVVAEGVEGAGALALLAVMGCDMVQGYLVGRPVPLDALLDYLDSGAHLHLLTGNPLAFMRTPDRRHA